MNIICPTPSQAAFVLKDFLKKEGVDLKLSVAQEAVARTLGYASWQALAANIPVRVPRQAKTRKDAPAANEPTLLHFLDAARSVELASDDARETANESVLLELTESLRACPLLSAWDYMPGRGECWLEDGNRPFLQVSFSRDLSTRFGVELVFTLRDAALSCYVRTWEFLDNLSPSTRYQIFDEESGRFDTNAAEVDDAEPLSAWVQAAVDEAETHITALREIVNIR